MSQSKNFEKSKSIKGSLSAVIMLGSLGLTSLIGETAAHASGPDMPFLVTNSAKKIVNLYEKFKTDPAIADATTIDGETSVSIVLPSVYGSYLLSATVSSLVNVNEKTVSNISVDATFPERYSKTKPLEAAYYDLNLTNGQVTEAVARYVNPDGTKVLGLDDQPKSSIDGQPQIGNIIADVTKDVVPLEQHTFVALKANIIQRESDANIIGYTIDNLIAEAKIGAPISGDTVAPPIPLAGNF